ncbi:MFS transporter [Halomonas sp. PR-M31]|uniref:MFS transporter n=1 Tax=Halomonas sp. PR-M31 TaxID=1471202 RepID=UPI00069D0EFC|nr:MFS transporter [Halomonas sp. PR-M31]
MSRAVLAPPTTVPPARHALWRISASAALLGLGQNGLLVALPVLVATFGLPLSQWAGLILLGSIMFLFGSPFWGQIADRHGSRIVVLQALAGYITSFALIGLALWLSTTQGLPQGWLISLIAMARILYGLTVSGMVPACQQWAVALGTRDQRDDRQRVAALAIVSAGLSAGRLLGPLIAAASLSLSAYAPFAVMLVAGLAAVLLVYGVPVPRMTTDASRSLSRTWPPLINVPFLIMAILLSVSVALMQLGLPVQLQAAFVIDATEASHMMGLLLSLSALAALGVQLGVIRAHRFGWQGLLTLGALGMVIGYALLFRADGMSLFVLGVGIASAGAALIVPGYTAGAGMHQAQGASAGFLGMAHTLGYAGATLLVGLADPDWLLGLALLAALIVLPLVVLARYLISVTTPLRLDDLSSQSDNK